MLKQNVTSFAMAATGKKRKLLGEALLEKGIISGSQLDEALKSHAKTKKQLGMILVNLGYVAEEDIAQTIADMHDLQYLDLDVSDIEPESIQCISPSLAQRYGIIPLKTDNGFLHVVCDRPLTSQVTGNIRRLTGKQLVLHISTNRKIQGVFKEIFKSGGDFSSASEDTAIIKLVDELIEKAIRDRASDIHVETRKEDLRVRLRVDGLLREIKTYPNNIAPLLVSRIKIISGLNIAEKRSPQDGGFTFSNNHEHFDIRVSVLPNIYGEKVVLRLLASEGKKISFESLGIEPDTRETLESMIKRPYGIILLGSPTGSGKSTTLYVILRALNSEVVNITTVEDPVEYKIDGITQVQVDQAMKVTFPNALRSILRQDPDIIMIGEIRDRETAEIALQASLTGHLVLATIHSNDAPGALTRLIDMGCEPFLVSSAVCGIMAQRLVRTNCPFCKAPFEPSLSELKTFYSMEGTNMSGRPVPGDDLEWVRGAGCRRCYNTGYRGRIAIFELLKVNNAIQQKIIQKSSTEKIRKEAVANGMRPLFADGILKVNRGITTPEEIMRVSILE